MIGTTMIRSAKTSAVWAALSLALVAGVSTSTLDADQTIENGFASVISGTTDVARPAAGIVAGSEDYWLRQPVGANGVPATEVERVVWKGPVAAGGKLVIGSGSSAKQLEVISVEQAAGPATTRIDMGTGRNGPLRVQARDGLDRSAPAQWLELTPQDADHEKTPAATLLGHSL
jgi:hypothetical protein